MLSSDFACFVSNYTVDDENTAVLPKIYRFEANSEYKITTSANGYKTLVSSIDATLPEGLKAYVVSTIDNKETAKLTEVVSVKAGVPYILKGKDSTEYTLTSTTSASAPENNELKVSDSNTANGVFVLATHNGTTAFYKWNGGRLGSGRVYLPAPSSARQIIFFDEEATGIADVKSETATDNRCYNLNGQRVAQPQKGLYIVNGKKIIKK